MRVTELGLAGVLRIDADVHHDDRGLLMEVWRADRYAALGIGAFVQDNHSRSVRGVVRGLHFQLRHPQGKLVGVIRGSIRDVVADVRHGSPTFGQHVAVDLVEGEGTQVWVPPGYAHGFVVTSDIADVLYKNTDVYRPEDGRGVRFDDPRLAIDWGTSAPRLSPADAALPTLDALGPDDLPRYATPSAPR